MTGLFWRGRKYICSCTDVTRLGNEGPEAGALGLQRSACGGLRISFYFSALPSFLQDQQRRATAGWCASPRCGVPPSHATPGLLRRGEKGGGQMGQEGNAATTAVGPSSLPQPHINRSLVQEAFPFFWEKGCSDQIRGGC